jgi:hypothetical protein
MRNPGRCAGLLVVGSRLTAAQMLVRKRVSSKGGMQFDSLLSRGSSVIESSERTAPFASLDEAVSALIDSLSDGAPTLVLGEALLMEALAIMGAHEGRAMLAEHLRVLADEIERKPDVARDERRHTD